MRQPQQFGADVARLAAAVRAAREDEGFTRAALAESCGVSANVIENVELGRTDPTASLTFQLCRFLRLDLPEIIYGKVTARRLAS